MWTSTVKTKQQILVWTKKKFCFFFAETKMDTFEKMCKCGRALHTLASAGGKNSTVPNSM